MHGFTKAAIVIEKQNHNKRRQPCTSNKYYSVCVVHRFKVPAVYGSIKPETLSFTQIMGFLFKNQSTILLFTQVV